MRVHVVSFTHYALHFVEKRDCHRITSKIYLDKRYPVAAGEINGFIIFTDTVPNAYLRKTHNIYKYVTHIGILKEGRLQINDLARRFHPEKTHFDNHRQAVLDFLSDPRAAADKFR